MDKRGQVTIFIILGLIIVAAGLIIYSISSGPKSITNPSESPKTFIQNCLEDDFELLIQNVSLNGGSINPDFYYHYYGNNVEFLCYATTDYYPCSIQRAFLREHIQEELLNGIDSKVESCITELESSLKEKGYSINSETKPRNVTIIPSRIKLKTNYSLSITKGETTTFEINELVFDSSLYKMISLTNEILLWEKQGLETRTQYFTQNNYPLSVYKYRNSNDDKIYTIKNVLTQEAFQFASRSMVYPAGAV